MSGYIINKTDGTVLTEITDGTVNQTASDLTLVGKNSSSYGEFINENFIHVLENFANISAPNHPIQGQLWYDTSEGRLKVYDGHGFKVSGGTIVSNTVPTTIAQGDIWIDSKRQQMYFNDGVSTLLAGPIYTKDQQVSGFQVVDIIDTNTISHTIVLLYIGGEVVGIFSKDTFIPDVTINSISNFSGTVQVGFNATNTTNFKFHAPTTQADTLYSPADQDFKNADSFLSTSKNSSTVGTIVISNDIPLVLGLHQDTEIHVDTNSLQFNSNKPGQNVDFVLKNGGGLKSALFMDAQNEYVGIYTATPTATLDVNGDAVIQGSLTVNGNLTTVNTTNLEIEDKLVELGKTSSPSNSTADGGGFSLAGGGDGDKTLTWNQSTEAWTSSENLNLDAGKGYHVNGFLVLNQTSLGTTVASAPGLTSVGTLSSLQVSNLGFNGSTISYVNPSLGNGDVTLLPKGSGTVNVSSKKISNLADPTDATDAVNKQTLENVVQSAPLALSINLGVLTDAQIISIIINRIYPVAEHQDGATCRIWCIDTASAKEFTLTGGAWSFTGNI